MNNIIIAALIGFSLGAAGYIVFRFWLLPIGRYQRIKDQIAESIRHHELKLSNENLFSSRLNNPRPAGNNRLR